MSVSTDRFDGEYCVICFQGSLFREPLYKVSGLCKCKGSLSFYHRKCINKLLKHRLREDKYHCESCKSKYTIESETTYYMRYLYDSGRDYLFMMTLASTMLVMFIWIPWKLYSHSLWDSVIFVTNNFQLIPSMLVLPDITNQFTQEFSVTIGAMYKKKLKALEMTVGYFVCIALLNLFDGLSGIYRTILFTACLLHIHISMALCIQIVMDTFDPWLNMSVFTRSSIVYKLANSNGVTNKIELAV